MPVFISLFYMLRTDLKHDICPGIAGYAAQHGTKVSEVNCNQVDPGSAKFLFIPDLTAKATGGVLITLILLYVGSQLASSLLMTVSADKNQRRMMIALPLIFVAFIINFPAGLLVYWITTNLWTILQQFIVRRTVGPIMPPKEATATPAGATAVAPASNSSGDGKPKAKPEAAAKPKREAAPPPPPRRKKKARSGRRR
jgi:YidC/Oxa1 family membrane protein insertase